MLEPILAEHGKNTTSLQKKQVTRLMKLEKRFRMKLVRHKWGPEVYKSFVEFILGTKRNILMARPYFRERDKTFKSAISPVLKERDHLRLYQFAINYQFVSFVLRQKDWRDNAPGRELLSIADEIERLRKDLAECNMPLAISQARIFLERNRRSHLRYMDMNQSCFVGLLEGIDKYVGEYHPRFRAVLLGRMIGTLIEGNSETVIHFFPPDKRRIYRARKIIGQMRRDSALNLEEVCKRLNEMEKAGNETCEQERLAQESVDGVVRKAKLDPMTTIGDLANLLAAAQVLPSSSLPVSEDDDGSNAIERYPADDSSRPDIAYAEAEARQVVSEGIGGLALVDKKLLRMKGVSEL